MAERAITRLLLLEDNIGDVRLLREMFNEQSVHRVEVISVECMRDAESYLAAHADVDIILLDLGLPDAHGVGAVRRAHAAAPHVPLVVLTGMDDEALAAQALQEGAQDYLIKGQIDTRGLMRALRYAIERKATALQIIHSSQHDFLTGLPNRMLLYDRIGRAIALATRNRQWVAVLFLDLDGFKHINDSLGHSVGDKLLQSIAVRLVQCVRGTDTVSRQGGDEFVVLLAEVAQPEDAAIAVQRVLSATAITAQRMLQTVAQAHNIDHHDLHVTVSIGVSVYPADGADAETLIKNADTAMYQAKDNGRQNYLFFEPAMNVRAVERQSIEESLRRAMERGELSLLFQPKIDLRTGAITGAEALVRWTHPIRGAVPPAQFIPIAEDCGLILPIGNWVLREACAQVRAWANAGLPPVNIAVNISAMQFRDERLLEGVLAILRETGLEPRRLELELTESVLMKRVEFTAAILQALRERGVRVAIDDFGTGYSSLSYLRKFPIDALKIDQSFLHPIAVGDDRAIATAVIAMARSLKLRVIAEGVETAEQLAFLQDQKCDEAQGFFFSPPVPAERFAALLRDGLQHPYLIAHRRVLPKPAA